MGFVAFLASFCFDFLPLTDFLQPPTTNNTLTYFYIYRRYRSGRGGEVLGFIRHEDGRL